MYVFPKLRPSGHANLVHIHLNSSSLVSHLEWMEGADPLGTLCIFCRKGGGDLHKIMWIPKMSHGSHVEVLPISKGRGGAHHSRMLGTKPKGSAKIGPLVPYWENKSLATPRHQKRVSHVRLGSICMCFIFILGSINAMVGFFKLLAWCCRGPWGGDPCSCKQGLKTLNINSGDGISGCKIDVNRSPSIHSEICEKIDGFMSHFVENTWDESSSEGEVSISSSPRVRHISMITDHPVGGNNSEVNVDILRQSLQMEMDSSGEGSGASTVDLD